MPTITDLFRWAVQYHQTGNVLQAEGLYRQILQANPRHADAWHLLGVLGHGAGRHDEAIANIRNAIDLNPTAAVFHFNLGLAQEAMGQWPDAARSFQEAGRLQPGFPEAQLGLGNVCLKLDKPAEAAHHYQEAVRLRPDWAGAYNNLGNALRQQRRFAEAASCFRQALAIDWHYADAHMNLGNALRDQGFWDEAAGSLRAAVQINPHSAEMFSNLGLVLINQGQWDQAGDCFRRALEINPHYAEARNGYGMVLADKKQLDEAVAQYREALRLNPRYAEAFISLGNAQSQQNKLEEAAESYRQAIQIDPQSAEAQSNLGEALNNLARFEEALRCTQRAVELNPHLPEAHLNMGNALVALGKLPEGIGSFEQALRLRPDYAEAHCNLGSAMLDQKQIVEAMASFNQALRINPQLAEAHHNLGVALEEQGRAHEAVASYRQALALKSDNPAALLSLIHQLQHLCIWDDFNDLPGHVIDAVNKHTAGFRKSTLSPFAFLALPTPTTSQEQHHCAVQVVLGQRKSGRPNEPRITPARSLRTSGKITIGYLSGDFQRHATAMLIAELFEKHDRNRFEIFGYSYGEDDGGPMRKRLVSGFDRFTDLRQDSFAASAQRIVEDGVHILVDLKGYTRQSRTGILALRPAPIQVNYLGYPGTMGAPFIDFILVDDFIVPPDRQPYYTEKLVHLPGCYQVNDSQRRIAEQTPSRVECGLPETGFVFASFNNSYKITPAVFDVWMMLLKDVPGSVLWLLEGNRLAPENLVKEARNRGVAAERLVFAPRLPSDQHLARHRQADLFLDTFPVNAHTTASDALWAGLPVLTIAGEAFVARVAGSLLRAVGLPELITTSLEEYYELALRLARNPSLLSDLRTRLEANLKISALFDAKSFARNLEKAYGTMWDIYQSGDKPRPFTVDATCSE